jgi:hypothetical protein
MIDLMGLSNYSKQQDTELIIVCASYAYNAES